MLTSNKSLNLRIAIFRAKQTFTYALPVKIVPNSIVYYENIDFAVLVDRQTET